MICEFNHLTQLSHPCRSLSNVIISHSLTPLSPLPLSSSFRHTGGGSAPAAAAGAPAAAAAPAAKAAPVEEEVDALDGKSSKMSLLKIWIQSNYLID